MSKTKMEKGKPNKQSYTMSLRMDEETYQKLNQISKEKNIKKSELLRNTFNEWINLKKILIKADTMIVGKNLLKGLLNFADDKEIIDLGKNIAEIWINELNIHLIDMKVKEDLDSMLTTFIDGMGSYEANWFDKINYLKTDNTKILIYGIHSLNLKFSIFIKAFLEHFMDRQFKFILNQKVSNISDTTIRLEFILTNKN